jgi:class 3 adenylate cyclase/predicted ATPase
MPEPARGTLEAERRQLTVMFCDLVGSTDLSGKLDPEDLREVVRAYQETAAEVIEPYEGYIAQYLGDGLLIYFGFPVAHEDDAQRAAHVGLGIVEAITTTLNPRLEGEKGVQLAVRIGIHTGAVVVGEMGGGNRHENLATGGTVNIAARLEGLASPNTVVISSVTERLLRGAFTLEDMGHHELKGVTEPMQIFHVLDPMEAHEDDQHTLSGIHFLVGRDEEMGLLLRRWEQSKEGLGQVVLLSGTAGIGKSSLVEMLRAHVRDEELPRIALRCSSHHRNSALYPVITHVEHFLHFERDDAPITKLDKLEQGLQTYSRPLREVVPLFAGLLSVPLAGRYSDLTLTSQQQQQQTLDALVAWMLEEAERQPILVAWEDLHWADPTTLEMLGLILEQTPTVPMLHVLTFRPEFSPPWPTRSHMIPITLNRLERPQVRALIMHLTGGKMMPAEVVEHIVVKTDGVPLYVEELTKMLLESGLLREEAEQYVLTGPLLTVAIPDTLQDSLMARLDQLNTAKEVAQLGAVLGREFPYDLLQAISSQDEATLQTGLAQLVEAELLYQRGRPPRARYIFKHALIQDAAYASLLKTTCQQVHHKIAQILEQRFPETAESEPELLAHHYTEAGLTEQAVSHCYKAGQRATERSAHMETINHLSKGLALLKTLPETPERTQQELDLQIALGPALMVIQGYGAPEVERTYARAQAFSQPGEESPQGLRALRGLWAFHQVRGETHTAQELSERLLRLSQSQRFPFLSLEAHRALGTTLFLQGALDQAQEVLQRGIFLYDPRQRRDPTFFYEDTGMVCLALVSLTLWLRGYPEQALQKVHEARIQAQELPHPYNVVYAQHTTAGLHALCGETAEVLERAEAAITLAYKHRMPIFTAGGAILRGWALAKQGQVEGDMGQMREGLATHWAIGAELYRPLYLAMLAEAYWNTGRADEGLRLLAERPDLVNKQGKSFYEAELYRLKGELLQSADCGVQDAELTPETCFQQALELATQQQAKSLELRAATSLARLWQQQDRRQDAYDLLAPVYEWFTEGFDTADLKDTKALMDELSTEATPPTA